MNRLVARRTAAAILVAGAALVAGRLFVVRVGPGSVGVLPGGRVLAPGWHLSPSASRMIRVLPGPLTVEGTAKVETPEGARREVPYRLEAWLDPDALAEVGRDPASGAPGARWKRAAEDAIREAASGPSGPALLRAGPGRRRALESLRDRPALADSRVQDLRLGAAAASGLRGRPPLAPIVLVGLDGADWLIIEPLLATGKLPNLEKLVRGGARAHLRSTPPLLSPLLWTSVVTGIPPDRHGVVDFTVYDPATRDRAPISSRARRVPALWNVLTAYGLDSAWFGWWATWPAEPVSGLMVSDRAAYSLFAAADRQEAAGKVYPPETWSDVGPRLMRAEEIPWRDLRHYVALNDADLVQLERRASVRAGEEYTDRLDHLRQIVASTRSYFELARWARGELRPDLLAVYFQGIDEVSHRFMHYAPPPRLRLPADEVRRFGAAVESFYREQDRLLGLLLAAPRAGAPEPVVMIVSDHGFLSGAARPPRPADEFEGGAADWHRLHGVFLMAGPGIRRADLDTVSLYDVFPTLLYLCGIPLPDGLPGRPLLEAFDESVRKERTVDTIAALDVKFGPEEDGAGGWTESERTESLSRLRALGYVAGPAGAGEEGSAVATVAGARPPVAGRPGAAVSPDLDNEFLTAHMNLGALYAERGEWESAVAEYRAVAERYPRHAPSLYKWMDSEFRRGQAPAAWTPAAQLLDLDPPPLEWLPAIAEVAAAAGRGAEVRSALGTPPPESASAGVWSALGILEYKEGRLDRAAPLLWRALEMDPLRTETIEALFRIDPTPSGRARLGAALRRALQIAPRSVFHLNYLAGLLVSDGGCAEARPLLVAALEERPDSAPARVNQAKCLAAEGNLEEAVALLERALRGAPDDLGVLSTLGALEAGRGRLERAIELLERALSRAPDDTSILNALALARLQSGQTVQARELLHRSLAENPAQPDVRSLLGQIPR